MAPCMNLFVERRETHQISQRIQLLPHQTALLPPPCHLPIHEVEEETKGYKRKGDIDGAVGVGRAETVAHGGEDGHEAAESCSVTNALSDLRSRKGAPGH